MFRIDSIASRRWHQRPFLPALALALTAILGLGTCGAARADGALTSPLGGLAAPSDSSSTTIATATNLERTAQSFMTTQLASYRTEYGAGEWNDAYNNGCWGCDEGGPTTAAAALFVLGGASSQDLLSLAVDSVNAAISDHQGTDGGFTVAYSDGLSEQMETMFYGVGLGTTDLLLRPYVSSTTQTSWASALRAAANYEINSGATTWYANGNVNLGLTELMWLAWKATGDANLLAAYNASLNFTIAPPQGQFPGAGWHTVVAGAAADGSDSAGYFAETGSGGTGFDPYYTMIQLDVAARLYLLSGDARVLRLTNMLANQELGLVNAATWTLDTSDGTRHTAAGTTELFQTSALAVLGFEGGRTDLLAAVAPEFAAQVQGYEQASEAPDLPLFRRAFGNDVATIALAAAVAQSPATTTSSTTTGTGFTAATTTTTTTTTTTGSTPTTGTTTTNTGATTTTGPSPTTGATSTTSTTTSTSGIPSKSKSSPAKHRPIRVAVRKATRRKDTRTAAARRKAARAKAARAADARRH